MEENALKRAATTMMLTERMHRCLFDANIRAFGLHRSHHIILMHLSRTDKIPSQKELSDLLGITPAAVTGAMKKLEQEGYILRTPGADTRFHEIRITQKGREVVNKSRDIFSRIDTSLFAGFTEEELETYVSYLKKIQENIARYKKLGAAGQSEEEVSE